MKYQITQKQMLKDFLVETPLSQAMIKKIKRDGDFLVNGQHQTVRYLLHEGDILEIILPKEKSQIVPQHIPLKIVYEDAHYLIIDKPPGIPCIPTRRYPDHTIANALIYYYQHHHIESTVHLVNRLDKETQGYMLVAKDSMAHALLSKDIKQVKRVYYCLVEGCLNGQGTIRKGIARKENSMQRYIDVHGKMAITHYRTLKKTENHTLVECTLETGRTHQIRVHMASIGHPLVGDVLYGSLSLQDIYLDSVEIAFYHPYLHKYIHFKK